MTSGRKLISTPTKNINRQEPIAFQRKQSEQDRNFQLRQTQEEGLFTVTADKNKASHIIKTHVTDDKEQAKPPTKHNESVQTITNHDNRHEQ